MTTYGVIPTGFLAKDLQVIQSEIEAAEREKISAALNLLATSATGQLNGIFADKLRELWDVAEAIYRAAYPDSATDEALEQVASITGVIRLAAARSTVVLDRIQLEAYALLPAGSLVAVGTDGVQFETLLAINNSAIAYPTTMSVAARSVEYGAIQGLSGTIDTIKSPTSGWSAAPALTCGNAEPYVFTNGMQLTVKIDGQASAQTITFLTADFVAIGAATAAEIATKLDTLVGGNAVAANGYVRVGTDTEGTDASVQVTGGTANALLAFSTSLVKGFNSLDATLGREEETNEEFRIRRVELLRVTGAGTLEALRARVRELDDVIQAFVFENFTMAPVDGLPAKSFELVVSGGTDHDIAESIFATKPIGIEPYGTESHTVIDSQTFAHIMKFSRPAPVYICMALTVLTDAATFPSDGIVQIQEALVALGDASQIGDDVIALAYKANPLNIAGVLDVTAFVVGTSPTPTYVLPTGTVNIVVSFRDLSMFDTSRIAVTVTT